MMAQTAGAACARRVLNPENPVAGYRHVEKERGQMGGKELAQMLNALGEEELLSFVGELAKHPELLEEMSDMLDVVLRAGEPSRDYNDFARELSRDGLM
jgi:hypothetical protein